MSLNVIYAGGSVSYEAPMSKNSIVALAAKHLMSNPELDAEAALKISTVQHQHGQQDLAPAQAGMGDKVANLGATLRNAIQSVMSR